ncbi:MAG: DUF1592 domain-containing protein [Planctomycetaceae bacterium]
MLFLRPTFSYRCSFALIFFGAFLLGNLSLKAQEKPAITWQADSEGFEKTIQPFFKEHCVRCHGAEKAEGNFRVDTHLPNNFLDRSARSKWGEVINVLGSHEMPPESERQPTPETVGQVTDWITAQASKAELLQREDTVILRRMNRDEYRNTMRDLLGVEVDVSGFPLDPAAGGFDNNGKALTISPLHVELYVDTARKALERALPTGEQPAKIRWRFEPEVGDNDSSRVRYENQNPIVNGGNNRVENGFKVMHVNSWDKHLNARDFRVKNEGEYVIRVRAGGRVPKREEVVASAEKILKQRYDEQMKQNPKGEKYHKQQLDRDLEHFTKDRIYDFGPPRVKVILTLGGQPKTVGEFDVDGSVEEPKTYEIRTRMSTESAGITLEYAYDIPAVLENFWMQRRDEFARPELLVDWFELEGPLYESWPPPSYQKVYPKEIDRSKPESEVARSVLSNIMRRAYRRPLQSEEIDKKLAIFQKLRAEETPLEDALQATLVAVLASPNFLYLAEPHTKASDGPARLNDHEMATRLSYFLWSSMPDDELFRAASKSQLSTKGELKAQVDRLLASPKSEALVRNFVSQWLGLREIGVNPPAMDLYPEYDRHLEVSIAEESRAFFREILRNDLSSLNFIRSDYVVINERLARYYNIDGVRGDDFRRVPSPPESHRGGIVTQASILSITSNGTRTSPVKRGTWVLKNLLGTDPGLPVANAGDIAPKVPGIDKATVRKRLEIHRELPQCARCHSKIDPLGFALENYNAAGKWRDQEGFGYKGRIEANDPKIDASGKLPDGTEIHGVEDLQQALLKKEDLFLKCLASKLLTYAIGRELGIADQPQVQKLVAQMKQQDYTLRSLIHAIVQSDAFQTK